MAVDNKSISIIEYAKTHLDPMDLDEINDVDFVIFSKLVYFNFEVFLAHDYTKEIRILDLYDFSKFTALLKRPNENKNDSQLISALCGNPRFRNIKITYYVHTLNTNNLEQFSAMTLRLENGDLVVVFRGTDASITGWNENFNMAIKTPVPAQEDALLYLNTVSKKAKKSIYVCGHSKGGNLALYSLINTSEKTFRKIKKCYSLDGPGLDPKYFDKIDKKRLNNVFVKIVPNESIIGMIFDNKTTLKVIKSDRSLLLQHSLYSWLVCGNKLAEAEKINDTIKSFDDSFNNWVKNCNDQERSLLIDIIFKIIKNGKVNSAIDVINNKDNHYNISKMFEEYHAIDKTKKEQFSELALRLLRNIFKNKK